MSYSAATTAAGKRRAESWNLAVESLSGVYKNMTVGVVALVYRCRSVSGEATPTPESQRVEWLTVEEIQQRTKPAYAIRVLDALTAGSSSRAHDGSTVLPP